eukprot:7964173-Pyramimonas_sp.AAC.1
MGRVPPPLVLWLTGPWVVVPNPRREGPRWIRAYQLIEGCQLSPAGVRARAGLHAGPPHPLQHCRGVRALRPHAHR